jgi:hypothetical protein
MKINSPCQNFKVDDLPENLFALEVYFLMKIIYALEPTRNEALKILIHQQDFAIIPIDVQMP